ncbi:MAG: hypothetical protein V4702_03085 [Patescibacteria group bacterium]
MSETLAEQLPDKIKERLGCKPNQKNILVRITLRHLEKTLTKKQANDIYDHIYGKINYGTGGYL